MAGDVNKIKIGTNELWKTLVYEYLSSGKRGKTNFYELLRTKYKCQKGVCLEMYDKYESEYDISQTKGLNDVVTNEAEEAAKNGLKGKYQRALEKQKDAEALRESVRLGVTSDFYISEGCYYPIERNLTETEKANILKKVAEIESEISKVLSDYAPTKQEVKLNPIGTDVEKDENYI